MLNLLKQILPHALIEKVVHFRQFIKAQREANKTTGFAKLLNSNNSTISIVFIISFTEAFSSFKPLYELLKKDERFSVFLICCPNIRKHNWTAHNASYEFLSKTYPQAINAYKDSCWFDIKTLSPDYVFYCRPYNPDYYENYRASIVRTYAKVCYIPYGFCLEHKSNHNFNFVNNYDFLQNCSYVFASNDYESNVLTKRFFYTKSKNGYPRILSVGFTRFDLDYNKSPVVKSKPFTVLYTPRWTSHLKKKNEEGTFLRFIEHIIDYASHTADVQIIIRPHPLMFSHYIQNNIVPPDYFEKLEDTCSKLGNIYFDKNKDYLESLNKADVFLSDYTSLLVEYFVSGKPVIYSGSLKLYNRNAKKMCRSFYILNTWKQIEERIQQLKNKEDPLLDTRKKLFSEIIKNYKEASKNILEVLVKDFNTKGEVL